MAALPALAQTPLTGDADAGRETFNAECRTCHNGAIAPSLKGVVGRKIAGAPDFAGYTPALKAKGADAWTEPSLDAFLKAPADFAPGTEMKKALPEDQARADIIAYLKAVSQPAE